MDRFENVNVIKRANLYFDGKCVSHSVLFSDGSRKTVGVIFPSKLVFNTAEPERIEINAGRCRIRLDGSDSWQEFGPGSEFSVPGHSKFDIETLETLDYVCHFG